MTLHQRLLSIAALTATLAACAVPTGPIVRPGSLPAAQPEIGTFDARGWSQIEMTVALRKGQSADELKALGKRMGFSVTRYWPQINSALIRVERFGGTRNLADALKKAPGVVHAQPAAQVILEAPDDPHFGEQYGMQLLQVAEAWKIEPGRPSVKIAIIDTGIDYTHPDLKDKIVPGYNAVKPGEPVMDTRGHGTHCAGIAAASVNNGLGVVGVGGNVSLMPVKVIDSGTTDALIADGVIWAADNGANVASMSIGLYRRSPVFERALQYALDKGVTLVASAGNNSAKNHPTDNPHLPSTHPGVIEVAATDAKDQKAEFSNWGDTLSVAAPGVEVFSTLHKERYSLKSGTSMAAPHVAGVAALILSKHPNWTPAQVKRAIELSAVDLGAPGFDPVYGHGRVNALAAVKL